MNRGAIGVLDSGLGGLSIWRELRSSFPRESLIYYGDGKHLPYGNKTAHELTTYVDFAVRRLIDAGAKLIVVACNTATSLVIDHLRASYSVPFVGLEPAIKPAVETTRSGVIGVLATEATLGGHYFCEAQERYGDYVQILSAVGEGFVELVERSQEQSECARACVASVLEPMLEAGADRIVLGCTHYPFLAGAMREVIADREVALIDSAEAICRRVGALLDELDLRAEGVESPTYTFMSSDEPSYLSKIEQRAAQIVP